MLSQRSEWIIIRFIVIQPSSQTFREKCYQKCGAQKTQLVIGELEETILKMLTDYLFLVKRIYDHHMRLHVQKRWKTFCRTRGLTERALLQREKAHNVFPLMAMSHVKFPANFYLMQHDCKKHIQVSWLIFRELIASYHLVVSNPSTPTGPRAWMRLVLIPTYAAKNNVMLHCETKIAGCIQSRSTDQFYTSAPSPKRNPSLNLVLALWSTAALKSQIH